MNNYGNLEEYFRMETISKKQLETYVTHVFENILYSMFSEQVSDISLKTININKQINGYIRIDRKKQKYRFKVYININKVLKDKNISVSRGLFYLYVTILHEFEHINIILNKECKCYEKLLAVISMEKELNRSLFQVIISRVRHAGARGELYKGYITSSVELWCAICSFKSAYSTISDLISETDKENVRNMCNALDIIIKNQVISYSESGNPFNKFIDMVEYALKLSKKNNGISVFDNVVNNGILYSIDEIYAKINEDVFFEDIMINYFLNVEQDYAQIFNTYVELRNYMENIINRYYDGCIEYIKNRDKLLLFLTEDLIEDNLRVMLNYIKKIEKYIEKKVIVRIGERILEI